MSVPFCASTACPLAQGVQNANTSHFSPSSPPSWSKAGAWVGRESGKHGSNCTVISDFGPHRSTLASLPTPPGSPPSWSKAGVWVERESGKHGFQCNVISDFGPHRSTLASLPTLHPALHPRGRKRESGSNESGKHGSHCTIILEFGPHRSTLASLPTLHPALHPRGQKQESGSKERVGSMASSALSSQICMSTPPRPWTPSPDPSVPSHSPPGSPPSWSKAGVWVERESRKHGSNCIVISDFHSNFGPYPSTPVVESEGPGLVLSTPVVASESLSPLLSTTVVAKIPLHSRGRKRGSWSRSFHPLVASESLSPLLSTTMVASEIGHSRLKVDPSTPGVESESCAHTPTPPWSKARVLVSFFPPLWSQVRVRVHFSPPLWWQVNLAAVVSVESPSPLLSTTMVASKFGRCGCKRKSETTPLHHGRTQMYSEICDSRLIVTMTVIFRPCLSASSTPPRKPGTSQILVT
ncbi:hypothetical protein B0H11DRAFT_2365453 [Mycena galericulata]|nr:hypothetical protein B0H11DRAFT_2365453 [Mycena galericulata]